MKNFEHKVAIITGAASGFGLEFARKAAALKMRLVLADVAEDTLNTVISSLSAGGCEVIGMRCDVSKGNEVEALAELAMDKFGAINLVFNNAGVGSGGLVWENTVKDWEWVLGVNVWGVIHGVRVFTPLMLQCAKADPSFEGYIVNTASMAGLLSPQLMGAYNVSKHAVVALSETLFHDLAGVNAPIGCSVLCPAFVPTGISTSHRTRPSDLQNDAAPTDSMMLAQKMTHKAVTSGKLTAADVAEITFAAIAENKFYIITHPKIMATVEMRLEDIAKLQNPRDPFGLNAANRPDLAKAQ